MQGVYPLAGYSTGQVFSVRVVDGVAVDVADRAAQLAEVGVQIDGTP